MDINLQLELVKEVKEDCAPCLMCNIYSAYMINRCLLNEYNKALVHHFIILIFYNNAFLKFFFFFF